MDPKKMKMHVFLDRVTCRDTEDSKGTDDFYVTGGVVAGVNAKEFLTRPRSICKGQTMLFAGDDRKLFTGELPKFGDILIELTAWDADLGGDWEQKQNDANRAAIQSVFSTISRIMAPAIAVGHAGTAIGDSLAGSSKVVATPPKKDKDAAPDAAAQPDKADTVATVGGIKVASGLDAALATAASIAFGKDGVGALVALAGAAVTQAVKLDKDDQLGTTLETVPVKQIREDQQLMKDGGIMSFEKTFTRAGYTSSYDYTIHYSIHLEP